MNLWMGSLLILFLVLMTFSALFSSSETVFFSLGPLGLRRLSQRRPDAGKRVHTVISQPTRLLSTVLIGNTIVNVGIAAVGYAIAEHFFPGRGERISIPVVTVLLVIFCEAGPKRLGLLLNEPLSTLQAVAIGSTVIALWLALVPAKQR